MVSGLFVLDSFASCNIQCSIGCGGILSRCWNRYSIKSLPVSVAAQKKGGDSHHPFVDLLGLQFRFHLMA